MLEVGFSVDTTSFTHARNFGRKNARTLNTKDGLDKRSHSVGYNRLSSQKGFRFLDNEDSPV